MFDFSVVTGGGGQMKSNGEAITDNVWGITLFVQNQSSLKFSFLLSDDVCMKFQLWPQGFNLSSAQHLGEFGRHMPRFE